MPTISAVPLQANKAYSTLTRQLKAAIIEVSMVQELRLRSNPWRVHEAKYLPPTKVAYNHTQFHDFTLAMLAIHLQNLHGHMHFFKPLLT